MRELWLVLILFVTGCGHSSVPFPDDDPAADRLDRGAMVIVYDEERDHINAHVKSGTGFLKTDFTPLPVGTRVTVLDDDGPGPERSTRVAVTRSDYEGSALVPRKNLRPTK